MGHRHWQRGPTRGGDEGCLLFVEFPSNGTLRLDGVRLSHSLACGEHCSIMWGRVVNPATCCRLLCCFTGVFKVTASDSLPAAKRFFCFRKQNIV